MNIFQEHSSVSVGVVEIVSTCSKVTASLKRMYGIFSWLIRKNAVGAVGGAHIRAQEIR